MFSLMLSVFAFIHQASANVDSVTYKGTLNGKRMHVYKFTTVESGTLNIEDIGTDPTIGISLQDINNPENRYASGDMLPAGTYEFTVYTNEDITSKYNLTLSGVVFSGNPDTSLPSLSITSPSSYDFRLSKGYTTLSGKGSTDGIATVGINDKSYNLPKGEFTQYMSFHYGRNLVEFVSSNENGNTIMDPYIVTVPGVQRLNGLSHGEVASSISNLMTKIFRENPDTVIIARSDAYGDTLGSVPLAVKEKAPILYTTKSSLDPSTKNEIQRLGATKAIILGGTGSISYDVESELKATGITTIERISGANNYAVATNIASRVLDDNTDTAIITPIENFADTLSASSIAGYSQTPILTTSSSNLSTEVKTFLEKNTQINHFIIVGGSISSSVEAQLKSFGTVERVSGSNRFEVANNMAEKYFVDPSVSVVADGTNYQQALAGSVLAARNGGPLMLVTPTSTPNETLAYYEKYTLGLDAIYFPGDTSSISDSTIQTLNNYIH